MCVVPWWFICGCVFWVAVVCCDFYINCWLCVFRRFLAVRRARSLLLTASTTCEKRSGLNLMRPSIHLRCCCICYVQVRITTTLHDPAFYSPCSSRQCTLSHPKESSSRRESLRVRFSNVGTIRFLLVAKHWQPKHRLVADKSPTLKWTTMAVLMSRQSVRRIL